VNLRSYVRACNRAGFSWLTPSRIGDQTHRVAVEARRHKAEARIERFALHDDVLARHQERSRRIPERHRAGDIPQGSKRPHRGVLQSRNTHPIRGLPNSARNEVLGVFCMHTVEVCISLAEIVFSPAQTFAPKGFYVSLRLVARGSVSAGRTRSSAEAHTRISIEAVEHIPTPIGYRIEYPLRYVILMKLLRYDIEKNREYAELNTVCIPLIRYILPSNTTFVFSAILYVTCSRRFRGCQSGAQRPRWQ
jgi:hypothetical protein